MRQGACRSRLTVVSRLSVVLLFFAQTALANAGMKPDTVKAWDDYIQATEARLQSNAGGERLWADQDSGRCERIRRGEILAAPVDGTAPKAVPHGLIHDWVGAVFIPNIEISDVLAVVQDYDRYSEYYGPTIGASRVLFGGEDSQRFRIRYVRKVLWITAVLDVDYEVQFGRLGDRLVYSAARSTCVQEIRSYGEPGQQKLPCDDGHGFIWRTYNISRYEARDQGVYVEQESIALSRDIPVSLRWLVAPVIDSLSKELVVTSLRQTRDAVISFAQTDRVRVSPPCPAQK